MDIIKTNYGFLKGVSSLEKYQDGQLKECRLNDLNVITTSLGKFTPLYRDDGVRKKYTKSLSFYHNGNIKSIVLDEQSIVQTGIGAVEAELITFYENGNLKRIFPLNGKITGYWTEENEYELAKNITFSFPFGSFQTKIISILFYQSGEVKSLTLWTKEKIKITSPAGALSVRIGLGLYPDGSLKSCEPAFPVKVNTPIGVITSYDVNASGINRDNNSLNFSKDGLVSSIMTSTDSIIVTGKDNNSMVFTPGERPSIINEEGMDIVPIKIEFSGEQVIIDNGVKNLFNKKDFKIKVVINGLKDVTKCGSCSNCRGCLG